MSIEEFYCVSPSKSAAAKVATVLFLGTTLTTGTGGGYFSENVKDWICHPYIEHRLPVDIEIAIEVSLYPIPLDVRTTLEHIENIKNTFDISISKIADMLNVSRQAVYKWLANSSTPEQEKQELIKTYSKIADKFKAAGLDRSGTFLQMKAFGNRSLSDIVSSGENPDAYITVLIDEAKIMKSSYKKSGLSESKAKPTNEWRSSISIPGFPEKK